MVFIKTQEKEDEHTLGSADVLFHSIITQQKIVVDVILSRENKKSREN